MAKSLWHADLVKMGPVTVTVKSDILKSKFSKPEAPKLDYVLLKIGNDDFSYNVESPECAMTFRGQKGKTIAIIAEGDGRQGTARVNYVGAPASQMQQPTTPAPQQQAPQPTQAPAAQPTASQNEAVMELNTAKRCVAQNRVLAQIAMQATLNMVAELAAQNCAVAPALQVAYFSSCLYGMSNMVSVRKLPLDYPLHAPQVGGGQ
jgi:hypothetical protein